MSDRGSLATTDGQDLEERYRTARAIETLVGTASYYHDSLAGNRTANGEIYTLEAFTCASRTLPFGSIVRVTRADDPSMVVYVRVNDRGPFGRRERILDLSRAAAARLGILRRGVAEVRAEVVELGSGARGNDAHRPRRGRAARRRR